MTLQETRGIGERGGNTDPNHEGSSINRLLTSTSRPRRRWGWRCRISCWCAPTS